LVGVISSVELEFSKAIMKLRPGTKYHYGIAKKGAKNPVGYGLGGLKPKK
jgi:hypothetical protein